MKNKIELYRRLSLLLAATALIFLGSCDDTDYNKSVIIITGTGSSPIVKFEVEDTPSSYVLTASSTAKVSQDVAVTFAIDNSLLEAYNAEHKTNYQPLPSSAVSLINPDAVIKSGTAASSDVTVKIVSTEDFEEGNIYVIPITITNVKGGDMEVLNASKTIFLRISRILGFNSLDMNNTSLYSNYIAPDALAIDLPNYTYEIRCLINDWHETPERISRLCSFTSKDESASNMLRFGENGYDIKSLQWVCPGGSVISSTIFNTDRWYTISLTFDGSKYVMYVDGIKDAELSGTKGSVFQRMELGMSWETYPAKQYFNGRIAEARVWNRALSSGELKSGICRVNPKSKGLMAYWKFDDGSGHIFTDATGNGYDMDWSVTYRDTGNGALTQFDKSGSVNWLNDDKNKCSQ